MSTNPIEISAPIDMQESDSMSSGFGSYEEKTSFSVFHSNSLKRKRVETVSDLNQMMEHSLSFSPKTKRSRENNNLPQVSPISSKIPVVKENGRPISRRSCSLEKPAQNKKNQYAKGNFKNVRLINAASTDSMSPRQLLQHNSPRRRINLHENSSLYSKYRLGASFSPLVTFGKRKSSIINRDDLSNSPKSSFEVRSSSSKTSNLRKSGALRAKTLNRRLRDPFADEENG